MDIEIERILDSFGEFKNKWRSKINISDETILAIGKRYFELASGSAKRDNTRQLDNPTYFPVLDPDDLRKGLEKQNTKTPVDVVEAAYIIKEYCSKRMCPGCPFSYQTVSTDLLCKCVLRNDDEVSITPEKWQLPPKEE